MLCDELRAWIATVDTWTLELTLRQSTTNTSAQDTYFKALIHQGPGWSAVPRYRASDGLAATTAW